MFSLLHHFHFYSIDPTELMTEELHKYEIDDVICYEYFTSNSIYAISKRNIFTSGFIQTRNILGSISSILLKLSDHIIRKTNFSLIENFGDDLLILKNHYDFIQNSIRLFHSYTNLLIEIFNLTEDIENKGKIAIDVMKFLMIILPYWIYIDHVYINIICKIDNNLIEQSLVVDRQLSSDLLIILESTQLLSTESFIKILLNACKPKTISFYENCKSLKSLKLFINQSILSIIIKFMRSHDAIFNISDKISDVNNMKRYIRDNMDDLKYKISLDDWSSLLACCLTSNTPR